MVDESLIASLARHWDDGWNGGDVDVIMAPFADEVVFSSPFLPVLTGDPDRRSIASAGALRAYVVDALARSGDVRYTLQHALAGTDTAVLVYSCHLPDGSSKPGADLFRFDGDGKVIEWRCHYATDPAGWRG
jgi:ketosteroid isomerase-like protein